MGEDNPYFPHLFSPIKVGRRAHDTDALKEALDVPVWVIGDCVRARQIGDSIREGWLAAMEIL